jgi:ribosomal-protein-alanine N-acetyltransferase
VIRALTADDADELTALLVENREFLAPFEPPRDDRFYTVEGQLERLEREDKHAFAILDG